MRGLHHTLKRNIQHGYVKLKELRPNSKELAKRLIEQGEIYTDKNGFLRLTAE